MATTPYRFILGMSFLREQEKGAFRRRLIPTDPLSRRPDNTTLLNVMLDITLSLVPLVKDNNSYLPGNQWRVKYYRCTMPENALYMYISSQLKCSAMHMRNKCGMHEAMTY